MIDVFDSWAHFDFLTKECLVVNGHLFLLQNTVEDIPISAFKKKYSISTPSYFYMSFSKKNGYRILSHDTTNPRKIMYLDADWVTTHHPSYQFHILLPKVRLFTSPKYHPIIDKVHWRISTHAASAKYHVREISKKRLLKPEEWNTIIHPSGVWQVEFESRICHFDANTTLWDFVKALAILATSCIPLQNRFLEGLSHKGSFDDCTHFDLMTGS